MNNLWEQIIEVVILGYGEHVVDELKMRDMDIVTPVNHITTHLLTITNKNGSDITIDLTDIYNLWYFPNGEKQMFESSYFYRYDVVNKLIETIGAKEYQRFSNDIIKERIKDRKSQ